MILHTNPFENTGVSSERAIAESLESLRSLLQRVLEALDRQKAVVMRIREQAESKTGSRTNIEAMLNEIDAVVDTCRVNDVKLLDGRFSRVNLHASMWFRTGPGMHHRERIYIQTMTSRSLGLREGTWGWDASGGLALRYLDKTRADIQAYISRLGFVQRFTNDYVRTTHGLEQNIDRSQAGLLSCATNNLETVAAVLARIRELAFRASETRNTSEKMYRQVEVSALVDEIDRIASQASYNRYLLLQGEFSRTNYRASMWFLDSRAPEGVSRIYIQTMTARGLGLIQRTGGFNVAVSTIISTPDRNRVMGHVNGAIRKVQDERRRLHAYLTSFKNAPMLQRDITISRNN